MENNEKEIKKHALSEEQLKAVNGALGNTNEMEKVYRINDHCVHCDICRDNCSMGCIIPGENEYRIDEVLCVGCGLCESLCPVGAIEQSYR